MINVRTITYGGDPGASVERERLAEAGRLTGAVNPDDRFRVAKPARRL